MIEIPKIPTLTNSKYWNSTDSAVFMVNDDNDKKSVALDVVTFEYAITQQKLPIYGYKSVTWDAVMKGTKLVQGTFSVPVKEKEHFDTTLEPYIEPHVPELKDQDGGGVSKRPITVYLGLKKANMQLNNNVYTKAIEKQALVLKEMIINSIQQTVAPTAEQALTVYSFFAKVAEPPSE